MTPPPRKPPPFQFGLGSLFGLTAGVAAAAAWLGAPWLMALAVVGALIGSIHLAEVVGEILKHRRDSI